MDWVKDEVYARNVAQNLRALADSVESGRVSNDKCLSIARDSMGDDHFVTVSGVLLVEELTEPESYGA